MQVPGFLLSMGDEPRTSKAGPRYHCPISVHDPEFALSAFTILSAHASISLQPPLMRFNLWPTQVRLRSSPNGAT